MQLLRESDILVRTLAKLGPDGLRGRLLHPQFMDLGHVLFSDHQVHMFTRFFSSHPHLVERITRIDPLWDGVYPPVPGPTASFLRDDETETKKDSSLIRESIWLGVLSESARRERRSPEGARALVARILISEDPDTRKKQLAFVDGAGAELAFRVHQLMKELPTLTPDVGYALLDLSLPALRELYPSDQEQLLALVQRLIEADGQVDLLEFAVLQELRRTLSPPPRGKPVRDVEKVAPDVSVLFSVLSWAGADSPRQARDAFEAARTRIAGFYRAAAELDFLQAESCSLQAMHRACGNLAHLAPGLQERLIRGCEAAIRFNGQINEKEFLCFRAAAAILNVPVCPSIGITLSPNPETGS